MTERRVFGSLAAAALLAALLIPTYPNYDSYYALVWGQELLDGVKPSFEAYAAPTQHPLWVAWAAVCDLLFGGVADRALVITCVLSLVALVWAVFRVGRTCFGPLSGAVGAAFVGGSFAFLLYAARGYVDVPFLALVLWAAALEAAAPRRGRSVMVLLLVAGLLRPEAWVLAGVYWLWCGWRRFDLLALVVVAPVLWCLSDLLVTGDALFSLHSTSSLAEDLGRERGLSHVPSKFVSFLADATRPPVFLAGLLGVALAWRERGRLQALHVPAALLGTGALTFAGTGVVGLSILPRYLTVPAVAICLLAGYAVGGFERLEPGPVRMWWTRFAVFAAVVGVAFVGARFSSFNRLRAELRFIHATHVAVARTADNPRVRDAVRCSAVTLPTYRLIPDLRFELHASRAHVVSRAVVSPRRGVALVLVGKKPIRRFGKADGVPRGTNVAPAGFALLRREGMLAAYAGADCPR